MLNFFELFDLPERFSLDETLLKHHFLALQKKWHPDNFVATSEKEKNAAMIQSANINQGFETLKNPAKRALHLLALQGVNTEENRTMPQEFLAEQFSLHEALDDAKASGNITQLETLLESVKLFETKRLQNLEKFLDNAQNIPAAIENLNALLFLQKLKANIESTLEELE